MTKQTLLALAATTALIGGWLVLPGPFAQAQIGDFARQERGRHLAAAGDCVACHTADGG
ncbi:hypothetical protein [Mesorhizobium sp. B2-3-12]|uniref:hypothetical protein n=1 Tax=Mesorhizobium sp. B2-3-12 TaxID=2589952 RepID=UPI0015E341C8|nr:hypothetical protein [Mesorhizobium sp. B2-3-12]